MIAEALTGLRTLSVGFSGVCGAGVVAVATHMGAVTDLDLANCVVSSMDNIMVCGGVQ